jgi:hypothetical protein
MNTLTFYPPLSAAGRRRRAASLKQVVNQRVATVARQVWSVLEAYGQRRAAPAMLRQADLLADAHPALAAELRQMARRATEINPPAATAARMR